MNVIVSMHTVPLEVSHNGRLHTCHKSLTLKDPYYFQNSACGEEDHSPQSSPLLRSFRTGEPVGSPRVAAQYIFGC